MAYLKIYESTKFVRYNSSEILSALRTTFASSWYSLYRNIHETGRPSQSQQTTPYGNCQCRLILNTTTRCRPGPKSAVRTVMPLHRFLLSSMATYDLNGHRPPRNRAALVLTSMQHGFHHVAANLKTPRLTPGRSRAVIIDPITHLDAVSSPMPVRRMGIARQP